MLLPMSSNPQPMMKVCCFLSYPFLNYMYSLQDPLYQYLFFKNHTVTKVLNICVNFSKLRIKHVIQWTCFV